VCLLAGWSGCTSVLSACQTCVCCPTTNLASQELNSECFVCLLVWLVCLFGLFANVIFQTPEAAPLLHCAQIGSQTVDCEARA
jgi:hypothetical protein